MTPFHPSLRQADNPNPAGGHAIAGVPPPHPRGTETTSASGGDPLARRELTRRRRACLRVAYFDDVCASHTCRASLPQVTACPPAASAGIAMALPAGSVLASLLPEDWQPTANNPPAAATIAAAKNLGVRYGGR
jgi:hypothetical protein